jgi:TPR repeat protein
MVEQTSRYRSYDSDIDSYDRYEEDHTYDRATHYRFGRSDRSHRESSVPKSSVPLYLSDSDGEPQPNEYMVPPRRTSISSRILAGVLAAAAVAILFALFSSDATRDLVVNAKASIASFPALLPGPSAAAQPDPARLTANDIQLKDPTRLSAPFNQMPGARSVATVAVAPAAAAPTRAEITTAYQSAAQGRAPATVAPVAVAPVAAAPARKLAADELATLMNRAKGLLAAGDIPSARLLLERAADAQEPSAALLLAQTYDPAVLGTQDERSITADPAAARVWYEKAAQFGSADAQQRLAQIQN